MYKTKITLAAGRGQESLSVTIEDEKSGQPIVRFELDAAQAWKMFGGGYLKLDAEMIDPKHVGRIGKDMELETVEYSHKDLSASSYDQMEDDALFACKADRPGWDSYSARRTNRASIIVTLRRWR